MVSTNLNGHLCHKQGSQLTVFTSSWRHELLTFIQKAPHATMLQKLSKCEVKAWLCLLTFDHFTATQILREIKFWWIQILVNSNGPKMSFLPILEVLNFDFSKFGTWKLLEITENQNSEPLKWPKMTFLDCLSSPKFDFTWNRKGSKIIKFQQCQAWT